MQTFDPLARGQWGRESWIQLKQSNPKGAAKGSARRLIPRRKSLGWKKDFIAFRNSATMSFPMVALGVLYRALENKRRSP